MFFVFSRPNILIRLRNRYGAFLLDRLFCVWHLKTKKMKSRQNQFAINSVSAFNKYGGVCCLSLHITRTQPYQLCRHSPLQSQVNNFHCTFGNLISRPLANLRRIYSKKYTPNAHLAIHWGNFGMQIIFIGAHFVFFFSSFYQERKPESANIRFGC